MRMHTKKASYKNRLSFCFVLKRKENAMTVTQDKTKRSGFFFRQLVSLGVSSNEGKRREIEKIRNCSKSRKGAERTDGKRVCRSEEEEKKKTETIQVTSHTYFLSKV